MKSFFEKKRSLQKKRERGWERSWVRITNSSIEKKKVQEERREKETGERGNPFSFFFLFFFLSAFIHLDNPLRLGKHTRLLVLRRYNIGFRCGVRLLSV
jgi:hypothetical protein